MERLYVEVGKLKSTMEERLLVIQWQFTTQFSVMESMLAKVLEGQERLGVAAAAAAAATSGGSPPALGVDVIEPMTETSSRDKGKVVAEVLRPSPRGGGVFTADWLEGRLAWADNRSSHMAGLSDSWFGQAAGWPSQGQAAGGEWVDERLAWMAGQVAASEWGSDLLRGLMD